jgi:hypothetical protein
MRMAGGACVAVVSNAVSASVLHGEVTIRWCGLVTNRSTKMLISGANMHLFVFIQVLSLHPGLWFGAVVVVESGS